MQIWIQVRGRAGLAGVGCCLQSGRTDRSSGVALSQFCTTNVALDKGMFFSCLQFPTVQVYPDLTPLQPLECHRTPGGLGLKLG